MSKVSSVWQYTVWRMDSPKRSVRIKAGGGQNKNKLGWASFNGQNRLRSNFVIGSSTPTPLTATYPERRFCSEAGVSSPKRVDTPDALAHFSTTPALQRKVVCTPNLHRDAMLWAFTTFSPCSLMQEKLKCFNSRKLCVATHPVCQVPKVSLFRTPQNRLRFNITFCKRFPFHPGKPSTWKGSGSGIILPLVFLLHPYKGHCKLQAPEG